MLDLFSIPVGKIWSEKATIKIKILSFWTSPVVAAVVKSPARAGATGSVPGLGGFTHDWASRPCATTPEAALAHRPELLSKRSPCKEGARSPQHRVAAAFDRAREAPQQREKTCRPISKHIRVKRNLFVSIQCENNILSFEVCCY